MEENKKDVLPLEGEPLTAPQISEPVVNALAAALSKIETYVPTQYIDDGPPDIDADHLNHAEQAIMRVTNLANGAADAISALQSQVTQLNNNKLDITGGTIQASESVPLVLKNSANDYSYLDFHGKSGRLGMLGMDKMNTPVFYDTNWEIHELALKSDLDSFAEFYQTNGLQDVVFQLYKHSDGSGKYSLQMILKTSTFTKKIDLAEFTI